MAHGQPHGARDDGRVAVLERNLEISTLTRAKALIFLAAGLSFLMSVYLYFGGDAQRGMFVGLWVPSILAGGSLMIAGSHRE